MSFTQIADIVQNKPFADYVVQRTNELSALRQSGIIVNDPMINALANGGGSVVNLPYFSDLTGDAEVLTDSGDLTPGKITAGQDVAVKCFRARAFESHQMAAALAGKDPMEAVAELIASYRASQDQKQLVSVLNGVFAELASSHVVDVTGTSDVLDTDAILAGIGKLGDKGFEFSAIAMHMDKFLALRAAKLVNDKDITAGVMFPKVLGLDIIVDDSLAPVGGNYPSILFARGAVAGADVAVANAYEPYRVALGSKDGLISRWGNVMHVRGVKYVGADNPSNTVLADGASWTKVYEDKSIRAVKLITK